MHVCTYTFTHTHAHTHTHTHMHTNACMHIHTNQHSLSLFLSPSPVRGFTNPDTAKLLLRRAGRHHQLRARSEWRKKMADPTERFTQFRRVTEIHLDLKGEWRSKEALNFRVASPIIAKGSQDVEFQWVLWCQYNEPYTCIFLSPSLSYALSFKDGSTLIRSFTEMPYHYCRYFHHLIPTPGGPIPVLAAYLNWSHMY